MNPTVLILDNGAHSIKAGFSESSTDEARIISNAIVRSKGDKRMYIGPEIDSCQDFFALHYRLAFEKGFLTDWDTEKAVWDRTFDQNVLGADPAELSLLVTEPYFNLPKIQETYDQLVFEEYEFQSCHRASAAAMMPFGDLFCKGGAPMPECMLVVDTGFSFTHVIPLLSGNIVWSAVQRIDVGGKLLTNHLKEVISYRHYNMMDQTFIVNEIKERCCYVTRSFARDLEQCRDRPRRNAIVREYVLPDFSANKGGFVRQPTQAPKGPTSDEDAGRTVLTMENERFSVPEILFNPSQIGLDQAGLPETIAHCVSLLPQDLRGLFWANIGLIGGNANFDGFEQRLLDELRPLAPADCGVVICRSSDPVTQAYRAAWNMARSESFGQRVVSRSEYLESGSSACRRKFGGQLPSQDVSATTAASRTFPSGSSSRRRKISDRGMGA